MYLSDDFYEEPMSRGANCYAAFSYPFHAKCAVSARSGMTLAEYREKLALFTDSFYFRNEGFHPKDGVYSSGVKESRNR